MRRLRFVMPLSLCLLGGCNDSLVDPPGEIFEPDCDDQGPVELLPLDDGEEVAWVYPVNEDGDLHVVVGMEDGSSPYEGSSSRRDVVIDRCASQVTELSESFLFIVEWGDVLLGCIDSDLVRLTGYDDPAPSVVARRGCGAVELGELRITLDAEPGATVARLLAIEHVGSELVLRELVADVIIGGGIWGAFPSVVGERAFVQTSDLAVRSVDPWTGEITVELDRAEEDHWSVRGDVIAYRPLVLDPEGADPLVIRDRQTGAEQILDAGIPNGWSFGWPTDGVLTAKVPGSPIGQRWFRLDPLRELVPPEGMRIETVRADGLVWLSRVDETTGTLELLRWHEGATPQSAWSCVQCGLWPSFPRSSLEVRVRTPNPYRYDLWRLPDADQPTVLIASGIGDDYYELDDGRLLTVPVGGDLEHGPLLLFDGAGGSAVTLAPRVNHRSTWFSWTYDVSQEIVYEAVPDDGPHALYRARLAP